MSNYRRHRRRYRGYSWIIILIAVIFMGLGKGSSTEEADSAADSTYSAQESVKAADSTDSVADAGSITLDDIPEYTDSPYVIVNNNQPDFSDFTTEAFETYGDLDELGRCTGAFANVCPELMPTEERGKIGQIKPTGWHTVKYDFVDGKYLYNRCHLIAYMLTAENANEKNLITGTRYLNTEGMLPFETQVCDYVKETGNHVLYRVTPIFEGDNLLASGVLMEAESVEDGGTGICFAVYCYNVQPGVEIDYATGESVLKSEQ
jgi:DNA-entry nuclease